MTPIIMRLLALSIMLQTAGIEEKIESRTRERETPRSFIAHTCILGASFVCLLLYRKYRMVRQEKLITLLEDQLVASQELQKLATACKESNDLMSMACKKLRKIHLKQQSALARVTHP